VYQTQKRAVSLPYLDDSQLGSWAGFRPAPGQALYCD
jgi:hypothetical protein